MRSEVQHGIDNFPPWQHWSLGIIGLLLSIFYLATLVMTILNIYEVKGRVHTKVLLRTQVIMLLIESFRLVAAVACFVQIWCWTDLLNAVLDVSINTSEFLSIIFAVARCIHLSNLIFHF